MKNLRIDPDTRIEKIIQFKHKRRQQLAELSIKLDELNAKIKETGDAREMERQAKRIYEREVEKGMADLEAELKAASIQSTWEAFQRCMSLTIPGSTVATAAAQMIPPSAAVIRCLQMWS
jgi:TolA-binding protein